MRILKIILIGLSLSIAGTIGLQFFRWVCRNQPCDRSSALLGGLLDATIFNPIVWILIIASFSFAYWLTKPRTYPIGNYQRKYESFTNALPTLNRKKSVPMVPD